MILIHYEWCLDMPSLTNVYLPEAFYYKSDVSVKGSPHLILHLWLVIGDLYPFFNIQTPEMYEYCMDVLHGSNDITDLVIDNYVCLSAGLTVFDLSVYPRLKTLRIGNSGFSQIGLLNITGLSDLESVEIGNYSFQYASLELKSVIHVFE